MALTATYNGVLSRIRLSATLLGASATYAVFEHTTDGVQYTTVRGGSAAIVTAQNAAVDDYEFPVGVAVTYRVTSYNASDVQQAQFTAVITQDLAGPWLKVPAAPYLNAQVAVADRSEVTRRSRAGVFDVIGRSNPVAVGDIASSRAYVLDVFTYTAAEESDLDYLFASGEILFVHAPLAATWLPAGYFSAGDVSRVPVSKVSEMMRWSIPLTEVAAPGPDVIGSAYTWTSAVAEYASWTALVADNLTWADLLERTGAPSDVIVP